MRDNDDFSKALDDIVESIEKRDAKEPSTVIDERIAAGVTDLLAKSATKNQDALDYTLALAANRGYRQTLSVLLEKGGANPNRVLPTTSCPPLHEAAIYGHVDCLEFLLSKGAKIEFRDRYGYTALHWASSEGHEACVRFLVEKGSHIYLGNVIDENQPLGAGATPLSLCEGKVSVISKFSSSKHERILAYLKDVASVQKQLYLHELSYQSDANPDFIANPEVRLWILGAAGVNEAILGATTLSSDDLSIIRGYLTVTFFLPPTFFQQLLGISNWTCKERINNFIDVTIFGGEKNYHQALVAASKKNQEAWITSDPFAAILKSELKRITSPEAKTSSEAKHEEEDQDEAENAESKATPAASASDQPDSSLNLDAPDTTSTLTM